MCRHHFVVKQRIVVVQAALILPNHAIPWMCRHHFVVKQHIVEAQAREWGAGQASGARAAADSVLSALGSFVAAANPPGQLRGS